MAFTDRELDIARQIKEQWWSREDFIDVLQQIRAEQPEVQEATQVQEQPELEWVRSEEQQQKQEELTQQIIKQEPDITPEIAASKARQQLAEQDVKALQLEKEQEKWFFDKAWESLKEEVTEWVIWTWIKTAWQASELLKEWEIWKWALKTFESWFQITGGTVWEIFDQALLALWEFWLKPWLEQLDTDTLAWLWDKANTFIDTLTPWPEAMESINETLDKVPDNIKADIMAWLELIWFKIWKRAWKWLLNKADDATRKLKRLPWTKAFKAEKLRLANRSIRDNVSVLTWATKKVDDIARQDFAKLISENISQIKGVRDFDELARVVENIWTRDINQLNKALKWIKNADWTLKTFKHQPTREVLTEMIANSKNINLWKVKTKQLQDLLKKLNNDWLTLSEINGIKKNAVSTVQNLTCFIVFLSFNTLLNNFIISPRVYFLLLQNY